MLARWLSHDIAASRGSRADVEVGDALVAGERRRAVCGS